MNPAPAPSAVVEVEVVAWMTTFVGGDGSGRRVFVEPWRAGLTVREVLRGVAARFPELDRALWRGSELGEHAEIVVNDAILGIAHDLDSPVHPGDRVAVLGQFMGGSHGVR